MLPLDYRAPLLIYIYIYIYIYKGGGYLYGAHPFFRPPLYIYIYIYIYIQRRGLLICRAHSFPRPPEFRAEPRNLGFLPRNWAAELGHGIRLFAAEFDVFHSNNYFFTENDLKVAL